MKRNALYVSLLVVAIAAAGFAFYVARRPTVIERPVLGAPPVPQPPPPPQALVGHEAPAFSGVDINGQTIDSSQLRGRVIVLNIWATWCGPCVEEMPRIEREIWQRFRPDVQVVAAAASEDVTKVAAFNRRMKLTFPLIADEHREIASLYGGRDVLPRIYVIDRTNHIVHQTRGYGEEEFAGVIAAVERAVGAR
jgi:peroxiredoxin